MAQLMSESKAVPDGTFIKSKKLRLSSTSLGPWPLKVLFEHAFQRSKRLDNKSGHPSNYGEFGTLLKVIMLAVP